MIVSTMRLCFDCVQSFDKYTSVSNKTVVTAHIHGFVIARIAWACYDENSTEEEFRRNFQAPRMTGSMNPNYGLESFTCMKYRTLLLWTSWLYRCYWTKFSHLWYYTHGIWIVVIVFRNRLDLYANHWMFSSRFICYIDFNLSCSLMWALIVLHNAISLY